MTNYHLGCAEFTDGFGLTGVMYFKSKFNREVGEKMTYQGKAYKVVVIGESKNCVIGFLNKIICLANSKN